MTAAVKIGPKTEFVYSASSASKTAAELPDDVVSLIWKIEKSFIPSEKHLSCCFGGANFFLHDFFGHQKWLFPK